MDYVRVYDALTQGRECLFDWVRPLSQEQYTRAFPFGLGTLRATLIDTARTELFYRMRLRGEPLPPPPPIPETFPISETNQPTFADLEQSMDRAVKGDARQPGRNDGLEDAHRRWQYSTLTTVDGCVTCGPTL